MCSPTSAQHGANLSSLDSLPTELRHMIWSACLPDEDPGAVYIFTPHWFVWCEWEVAEGLYQKSETADGLDVSRDRLIEVLCPTQLLHINRESRRMLLQWMKQRQYMLFLRKETGGHILVRYFIPEKDTLFIPTNSVQWLGAMATSLTPLRDPHFMSANHAWRQRLMANWFKNMLHGVQHIALPAVVVCTEMEQLIPTFLCRMQNLQTLTAVTGEWPQALPYGDRHRKLWAPENLQLHNEAMVQPRWELEAEHGPMVQMTTETRYGGMFWGEGPDVIEENTVEELLGRARAALQRDQPHGRTVINGRLRKVPDEQSITYKRMVWKSKSRCRRPNLDERERLRSKRLSSTSTISE